MANVICLKNAIWHQNIPRIIIKERKMKYLSYRLSSSPPQTKNMLEYPFSAVICFSVIATIPPNSPRYGKLLANVKHVNAIFPKK